MAIITTNPAHELDVKLGRIELENAAYYLRRLSEDAGKKMPKLSHIASNLADEIDEKLAQMQALIEAEIGEQ